MLSRLALLLVFIALGCPFGVLRADVIYDLNDHGTSAQNGYSIIGQLIVSNTAADDGVLSQSELISWNYTISSGATVVFTNDSSDLSRGDSLTDVFINGSTITTTDQFLIGTQFGQLVYRDGDNTYSAARFSPSYQEYWLNQSFTTSPMPIATIHTSTPEPHQLGLLAMAVAVFGIAGWSRGSDWCRRRPDAVAIQPPVAQTDP